MGWEAKAVGSKKLWNSASNGRKSVGSGILPIEMLSLELITAIIRCSFCHRDPGDDAGALPSAEALLEKSKSLRKPFNSAYEDGSAIEQPSPILCHIFQSFYFVILLLKFSDVLPCPLSMDTKVYFSSSFLVTRCRDSITYLLFQDIVLSVPCS